MAKSRLLNRPAGLALALALVLLAAGLGSPTPGAAGSHRDRDGDRDRDLRKWWQDPVLVKALQLTAEEVQTLDQKHLALQKTRIAEKSRIQIARAELDSLFDQEHPEQAQVEAKFQEIAQAQARRSLAQSNFLWEVRQVLRLDRYLRLKSMFQSRRSDRGGWRQSPPPAEGGLAPAPPPPSGDRK
ncbi:MAG: periplasmic heavy metal sensor [Deltaproteobacteria bacterium]|nr:periplasmic heavy metal sensor [Deltaproteobacteria bacterium]